jgi:diaminohydroxyphosphoribosylaminopyrimidine deaminase/5-amino-6-(5-phosphoribosylamino)uracil reductase
MDDAAHMRSALGLARRGLGTTWPNPSVGCVIVRRTADGDRVVGRGLTASGGRPHAETVALAMAGEAARGATAYVTPCTEALIAAGIARVVFSQRDPDPRVDGSGAARLRDAGVIVEEGLLADEAAEVNAGFLSRVTQGRPLVTLKLATTLDGRIATGSGESIWITGPPARRRAHALRGRHDAVLAGVGTVMADDPALTCRLPGFRASQPVRIIADSNLRTALTSQLVTTARQVPTWVLHRAGADPARRSAFSEAGVRLIEVDAAEPGIDLAAGLRALGAAGLTRLLVEGGARIAAGLLRAGLVDRIAWFHAPAVMGGDGLPAAQAFGDGTLASMPRFRRTGCTPCGDDVLTELRSAA